ncbi:hypothetical protein Q1W73_05395 [Asticcacaulis sp. ZE23SCel15]|uniref:hypothetical protein n=1 Tax=Asticcacaulis sp. ZE23SCel15 TaxID=3059027 RepID=UPI00265E2C1C|nr:hypothetical protein [Asticcacaulis sp. ZE23SCel15]WKL58421.1 hypothetical protein Q1W73_05395 [Asticcacaulis sp. ZE23SCel15]
MNASEFSDAFISAARSHGDGSEIGNSTLANQSYDKLINVVHKYRLKYGPERELVLPLLSHENSSIRTWAALFSLPIDEKLAIHTLSSVSKEPGIIGFSAKITLAEWNRGVLKIP